MREELHPDVDPATDTLDVPPVLGRYRLGRRLGSGGFGAVHEAFDERLQRLVAIKVIPSDASVPARAAREALAAARLDHPGIVAVYDAGEEPGARYLVSELVEGRTLAQLEAQDALSDRDVLRVGLALTDALAHAHERGVVHRDVKPQNVMVPDRPASGRGVAKLTDFGVAHLVDADALTRTGDVVGTLAYMAPEQASGKRVDARTDLYALGLVLYEAFAGANPVRGANPAATARRVGTPLAPLARRRRDLPTGLCAAVDRAVKPRPAERGTLDDLADAIVGALDAVADAGGALARHPLEGPVRIASPRASVRRAAAAAAAAALVAAALRGAELPVPPVLVPLAVAVLVALLPRAGWALAAAATTAALVTLAARPGAALVVAAAAMPVVLLLSTGRTHALSLPALAPALGLAALATAYPVLAALGARTWRGRAALGALGAWWLALAEPVLDRPLLLGPVDRPPGWETDAGLAAERLLGPVLSSGTLLVVPLWALAAALLPVLVRGVRPGLDLLAGAFWAIGLGAGTGALAERLGAPEPRGLAVCALVAGIAALAAARVGSPRTGHTPGMALDAQMG